MKRTFRSGEVINLPHGNKGFYAEPCGIVHKVVVGSPTGHSELTDITDASLRRLNPVKESE